MEYKVKRIPKTLTLKLKKNKTQNKDKIQSKWGRQMEICWKNQESCKSLMDKPSLVEHKKLIM